MGTRRGTENTTRVLFDERFTRDRPAGRLVGHDGWSGRDREQAIGVDGGAARFRCLAIPGWDRQSLSRGPLIAEPGLMTCWHVLNAHNTSMTHEDRPIGPRARLSRFVRGLPQLHWREPHVEDNLAVGWYPAPRVRNPLANGSGIVMHAGDTTNGELQVVFDGVRHTVATGVQNLPIHYAQILRPDGVLHLVATSLPTFWAPVAPVFRPIGFDPAPPSEKVWAAVHQAMQGEVKYRIDTRIEGFVTATDDAWSHPGAGATWRWEPGTGPPAATLDGPGLVLVETAGPGPVTVRVDGTGHRLDPNRCMAQLALNGPPGRTVGLEVEADDGLAAVEVLPAEIEIPSLSPDPAWVPPASHPVHEGFPSGAGLLREQTGWERIQGTGEIDLLGRGEVQVRASRDHPNPGRTLHTLEWGRPDGVDVWLRQRPPGNRGEGHRGRSGICVVEDDGTCLVVNNWLDDSFDGASISCFWRIDGHEEMYDHDAVWSNVGHRVRHGVPHELRVVVDGRHLGVWLEGEPVMYRRIDDLRPGRAPMRVRAVGVASNWEWGDDTGTAFLDFRASELIR